jgi:hypothetical protein
MPRAPIQAPLAQEIATPAAEAAPFVLTGLIHSVFMSSYGCCALMPTGASLVLVAAHRTRNKLSLNERMQARQPTTTDRCSTSFLLPGGSAMPGFARDIRPLFRDKDVAEMSYADG